MAIAILLSLAAAAPRLTVLPSLQRVVASRLGLFVDKSLQCSDWDARPLSAAQLAYAGLDAEVLLRLARSEPRRGYQLLTPLFFC